MSDALIIVTHIELLICQQYIVATMSSTTARDLTRTNDGAIFRHLQTSRVTTDVWHHTTLFVLPSHNNSPKRSAECYKQLQNHNATEADRLTYLCHRFPPIMEALNVVYGQSGVHLRQMEQEIRDAIPRSHDLSDAYRRRRGLGTWMGSECPACSGWSMKTRSSR